MRKYPRIWAMTVNLQWAFSKIAVTSVIALGLLVSIASLYFNLHRPTCLTLGQVIGKGLTINGTMAFNSPAQASPAPATPSPPTDKPEEGVFTDKTPSDFAKFYGQGLTELQADALMKPFIGLWIRTEGRVTLLSPDDPQGGTSVAYIQYGDKSDGALIWCRFPGQLKELSQVSIGDQVKVVGKIYGHTSSFVELEQCELEPTGR